MTIVHISTRDIMGGAARSAHRLHQELRALGRNSRMFVLKAGGQDPDVVMMGKSAKLLDRIQRRARREAILRDFKRYHSTRGTGFEPFQDCRSEFSRDFLRELPAADAYNLHWVGESFLDYASFFARVSATSRVVWTLHDMNAFTGGCHYDLECGRFSHGCGQCPQLGSKVREDLSRRIWKIKGEVFSRVDPSRLQFVSPSCWLADEFRRSPLGERFQVSVIPNGLNMEDFAPRDRAVCRDILGLPKEGKVLLFLADDIDNERKGFDLLVAALEALPRDLPVTVLSVGRNRPDVRVHVPWVHAGSVDNDRQLSVVYSAADIFVMPSRQDNLPNTVLESMACGTPVLGHSVGGIQDMVRPGVTGAQVPPEDVEALTAGIVDMLGNPQWLDEMSANCRRVALEEYPLTLQASRYIRLYDAMTGKYFS
jgi:glycosyltransferase involved in cell wall biosynthesis